MSVDVFIKIPCWKRSLFSCKIMMSKTERNKTTIFFQSFMWLFILTHILKPFYIEFRVGRSNKCEAWVDVSSSEVSMFFASTNVAPGTSRLNFQLRCCTNGACRRDSVCYSTSESCSRNERKRWERVYDYLSRHFLNFPLFRENRGFPTT